MPVIDGFPRPGWPHQLALNSPVGPVGH